MMFMAIRIEFINELGDTIVFNATSKMKSNGALIMRTHNSCRVLFAIYTTKRTNFIAISLNVILQLKRKKNF